MDIGKYCNREVIVTEKDATIIEIAQLMRKFHVGDVVIVEPTREGNRPVGIVTDRDLVIEILAQELDPGSVTAVDFMSTNVITVRETDDLLHTLEQMRAHGVRRIPVVNEQGDLEGILTVDDVLELVAEQLSDLATLVRREVIEEKRQHP
jgi:CBS domain-containing protein